MSLRYNTDNYLAMKMFINYVVYEDVSLRWPTKVSDRARCMTQRMTVNQYL